VKYSGFFCAAATAAYILSSGPASAMCADRGSGGGCLDNYGIVAGTVTPGADGTFELTPIEPSDRNSGGAAQKVYVTHEATDIDGNKIEYTSDGRTTTYRQDGSSVTLTPERTTITTTPDGKVVTQRFDGSREIRHSDNTVEERDAQGNLMRLTRADGLTRVPPGATRPVRPLVSGCVCWKGEDSGRVCRKREDSAADRFPDHPRRSRSRVMRHAERDGDGRGLRSHPRSPDRSTFARPGAGEGRTEIRAWR
jgi:hypothetical protein